MAKKQRFQPLDHSTEGRLQFWRSVFHCQPVQLTPKELELESAADQQPQEDGYARGCSPSIIRRKSFILDYAIAISKTWSHHRYFTKKNGFLLFNRLYMLVFLNFYVILWIIFRIKFFIIVLKGAYIKKSVFISPLINVNQVKLERNNRVIQCISAWLTHSNYTSVFTEEQGRPNTTSTFLSSKEKKLPSTAPIFNYWQRDA